MDKALWIPFLLISLLSGCTHAQLRRSAVSQGSTLTDIQYKQVLDNVALFVVNPAALPHFATASTGNAQVTDTVGLSAFTWKWTPAAGEFSLIGQRANVEGWNLLPILEPDRLAAMRCAYQAVTRAPPMICADCDPALKKFLKPYDAACQLPLDWFCVGRWKDVPKSAYYGHYGATYVWVPDSGRDGLTRFTLTILAIATAMPAGASTYTEEKIFYDDRKHPLFRKETRQLTEDGTPARFGLRGAASSAEMEYAIPRVGPGIQFFPQAR